MTTPHVTALPANPDQRLNAPRPADTTSPAGGTNTRFTSTNSESVTSPLPDEHPTTTKETPTAVDWTVLNINGVTTVAHNAAVKIARQYTNTIEYDDCYQEALILLATNPNTVRTYTNDTDKGLGRLHHWLWCDLVNMIKTEAKHRTRHISYEHAREGAE